MREIKAKAFDEKKKAFVRAKLIETESSNWVDERGFPVVWFTGRLDKDGVQIYGGHILEIPYEHPGNNYADYEGESGKYRGVVHYRPSRGYILTRATKWADDDEKEEWRKCHDLDIRSTNARVIGNIYDNPELLGEQP